MNEIEDFEKFLCALFGILLRKSKLFKYKYIYMQTIQKKDEKRKNDCTVLHGYEIFISFSILVVAIKAC
jgi:hypothetical protein